MDPLNPLNISNRQNLDDFELEALREPYQTILTISYIIMALLAFIGNTTAIATLVTGRQRSAPELKKYLINLFTTDILIALFSIPFSYTDFMYGQWIFPAIMCPITQFITGCAVCVSVYTLIAIGIERYLAIVYPFRQLLCFERHTKFAITIIWIIGIALSSPLLIESRALEFKYRNKILYDCRELWDQELGGKVYTGLIFITTFIIPLIALSFLYISIGVTSATNTVPGNSNRDHVQQQNRIKIVKMLVILVISFAACWLPIQVFNLVMWLCDDCRTLTSQFQINIYVSIYFICHFLSMAHALIDPIIYCFMSHNFKMDQLRSYMYANCAYNNRNEKRGEIIKFRSNFMSNTHSATNGNVSEVAV
ncbi:neuropeptide Y receptor type 5-like [Oppia nitens]|uniref:neuropeptide Y receptor type 5-like n=1 Tax=Oppia nitens TaxID=1686743 RepID=UPI0023DBC3C2|nr:neuropeptide Y receptor type 5-like [Oppia nitens]